MPNFYETLINELSTDPLSRGYASMTDEQVANKLHEPSDKLPDHTFKTMRAVIEALAAAQIDPAAVLTKLDTAATVNPLVAEGLRALRHYGEGGGLDFAHPATIQMLDDLVSAGVLTQAEADAIKLLGWRPASRAEVLGLGDVQPGHIESARKMMGG